MLRLNRDAAEAMDTVEVHAATDVTGFGLLGHLHYLARASGVAARLDSAAVPLLPAAEELADAGEVPGGTRSNERFLASKVRRAFPVSDVTQTVLSDAQTSGGLLIAVPPGAVEALSEALRQRGVVAAQVGELQAGEPGMIDLN
jgi:selenide,water dikinase